MYIIAQAPAAAVLSATAASTAGFTVIAGEPGAGTQVNLNAPGSNRLNGQPFTVRAAGNVSYPAGTYTASAIQILVCASNTASFAAATANAIASMTALTAATAALTAAVNIPFEVEVELVGDNTSKILSGVFQGWSAGTGLNVSTVTALARAAATNPLTTFNAASEPPVQFAVAVSTGANPAGTTVTLTQFVLEA